MPPEAGPYLGETDVTSGSTDASYERKVGESLGTLATPETSASPSSMAAVTRAAPRGSASGGGAAQRMEVVVRYDAGVHTMADEEDDEDDEAEEAAGISAHLRASPTGAKPRPLSTTEGGEWTSPYAGETEETPGGRVGSW